ncbi:hypothetical protein BGP_3462 [Beggiatoa sp. PS]|nr:hypothetical protein BGP_3462 [Beggiatoa sp. PS]
MTNHTDWHRLFGITLVDYFTDSNYQVELEKDLSLQQQYLDVIIIEQTEEQALLAVPDGLENLNKHNLLTYKSHQESLDSWALDELIGHYVNYRKQESPLEKKQKQWIPETDFQLYAITTHYPRKLAKQYPLDKIKAGVYELDWGSKRIRIIVLSQMSKTPNNTLWQLFSSVADQFDYAKTHHHWHNPTMSSIINRLYEHYQMEGLFMSYTIEDYIKETQQQVLNSLTPEERLKGIPVQEVAKALPVKELVKAIPLDVIEEHLMNVKSKQ